MVIHLIPPESSDVKSRSVDINIDEQSEIVPPDWDINDLNTSNIDFMISESKENLNLVKMELLGYIGFSPDTVKEMQELLERVNELIDNIGYYNRLLSNLYIIKPLLTKGYTISIDY